MAKACWLMKSEPEAFGIADLERVRVEPWTGVRNFQARNFMRDEMQVGDDVLFYHSNASPSGVAGVARVHRTGVVDETQFEPSSPYYDPKATRAAPIWICVEVAYVASFDRLISLDELRQRPELADMLVLRRGMRLSVQPVSGEHFARVRALGSGAGATPAPAQPRPAAKAVAKPAAQPRPAAKAVAKPAARPHPAAKAVAKLAAKPRPAVAAAAKPRPAAKPNAGHLSDVLIGAFTGRLRG
jgi:predicted RNA-binding protein with PUA-like domain